MSLLSLFLPMPCQCFSRLPVLGNDANSLEDCRCLRSLSSMCRECRLESQPVHRARYQYPRGQKAPGQLETMSPRCTLRKCLCDSTVHHTGERPRHQNARTFWNRCARLALAYVAVLDSAQNLLNLPGAEITINEIQWYLVSQRAVWSSKPTNRLFFIA